MQGGGGIEEASQEWMLGGHKEPRVLNLQGGWLVTLPKALKVLAHMSVKCVRLHVEDPWTLCLVFLTAGAELAACRTCSWL